MLEINWESMENPPAQFYGEVWWQVVEDAKDNLEQQIAELEEHDND